MFLLNTPKSDYPKYKNRLSFQNKAGRLLWNVSCFFLFRPFSLPVFNGWRLNILRAFGARIGKGSKIHASVRIWAPWNLIVGERTAIGPYVECYNPGKIKIGNKVTVSQNSYLCSASHDYTQIENPLITKSIIVGNYVWIAAGAFISVGVTIANGSIVGARSVVVKDVAPWSVVAGNPARFIKKRNLKNL